MVADCLLTVYAYHYPFYFSQYLVTWAWFAGVCLLGHQMLRQATTLRVTAAVLTSATSFFLLGNFVVWTGTMYAHTTAGLGARYVATLPFHRNDLVSAGLVAALLFGSPLLVARFAERREAEPRAISLRVCDPFR